MTDLFLERRAGPKLEHFRTHGTALATRAGTVTSSLEAPFVMGCREIQYLEVVSQWTNLKKVYMEKSKDFDLGSVYDGFLVSQASFWDLMLLKYILLVEPYMTRSFFWFIVR